MEKFEDFMSFIFLAGWDTWSNPTSSVFIISPSRRRLSSRYQLCFPLHTNLIHVKNCWEKSLSMLDNIIPLWRVITIHLITLLVDETVGLYDSSEKGMIATFLCITGLLVTRSIYLRHLPLLFLCGVSPLFIYLRILKI